MAVAPFGEEFYLNTGSYGSRISEFISRPVNYFITAFKPGYALQAEELNELQEQFYLQQTLSNRCLFNWLTNTTINGKPFGDGCTPLSPTQITVTNTTNEINIIFSTGWYYIVDKPISSENSGFGVWCYIDSDSLSITKTSINTGNTRIGVIYIDEAISANNDQTLNDGSNSSNASVSVPGADRIKFGSFDFVTFNSQDKFSDILTATRSGSNFLIKYLDGSILATING